MSTGEAVWDLIERAVEFMDSWTQKKLTTILNGEQTRWTPHPCEEGSLVSLSVSQGNRFLAIKATKISHEAKHDTLTVPFSLYLIINWWRAKVSTAGSTMNDPSSFPTG